MMKDALINLDDAELRMRAIEALNQSLGIAATHRFLSLIHQERTDYVQISRQLYEKQQLDEIFARAK